MERERGRESESGNVRGRESKRVIAKGRESGEKEYE